MFSRAVLNFDGIINKQAYTNTWFERKVRPKIHLSFGCSRYKQVNNPLIIQFKCIFEVGRLINVSQLC